MVLATDLNKLASFVGKKKSSDKNKTHHIFLRMTKKRESVRYFLPLRFVETKII